MMNPMMESAHEPKMEAKMMQECTKTRPHLHQTNVLRTNFGFEKNKKTKKTAKS